MANDTKWAWFKMREYLRIRRKSIIKPNKQKVYKHQRTELPGYQDSNWELFLDALLTIILLFGAGFLVFHLVIYLLELVHGTAH